MIRILSIIAVLGLTGCATASNTYLKNGKQGLSIDCSGEAMSGQAAMKRQTPLARARGMKSSALTAPRNRLKAKNTGRGRRQLQEPQRTGRVQISSPQTNDVPIKTHQADPTYSPTRFAGRAPLTV